ncbi:MAG: magnesium transporter CorA family protein [Dehalococcoidia bacterium]
MDVWSYDGERWHAGDSPFAAYRWFRPHNVVDLEVLAERFHLHPLAIDAATHGDLHSPRVDRFPGHLYLTMVAVVPAEPEPRLEEVDVFLGPGFLISFSETPVPELDDLATAIGASRPIRSGLDGLLYEIADRLVDGVMPEVNLLADRLDGLEERALDHPEDAGLSRAVVGVRARAGQIRRFLGPELAAIQRLSRGEFEEITEPNRLYFRDVYDHLVRVDISLEAVREDAEVVLSTYLSAVNNRMSEVMKVLSVVAALALPANVIAGIFGTNFDVVPGLHSAWGFGSMLLAMGAIAVTMALYFRRKGWW